MRSLYTIAVFLDPSMNPKCKECGSISIDPVFKSIFGCLVCSKCKDEHPTKYSLLTKTECREVRVSMRGWLATEDLRDRIIS